jgi:YfiH family protein
MIFPEIFDGFVMGFFTDRELGVDVQGLTGRKVYFPLQEHSDRVLPVKRVLEPKAADAVITDRHDILLGIQTADCVPILLFDSMNHAIGAVHAGWRGTGKGILKKTIKSMQEKYSTRPGDLFVAMGPAIRWCCYEVGEDVVRAVSKATGDGHYHMIRDGRNCLDLQSANKCQAMSMGISELNISVTEECTFCYPDRYYSYRYDRDIFGRQGGFIGMP